MIIKLLNPSTFIVRFDPDEEIINALSQFCQKEKIVSGTFSGIGTAKHIIISYYDLIKKKYIDTELAEYLEIVSLTGNISIMKENIFVHCHGIFSKQDFSCIGGHIKKIIVSGTCEIKLTKYETIMKRVFDPRTGLNLLSE